MFGLLNKKEFNYWVESFKGYLSNKVEFEYGQVVSVSSDNKFVKVFFEGIFCGREEVIENIGLQLKWGDVVRVLSSRGECVLIGKLKKYEEPIEWQDKSPEVE